MKKKIGYALLIILVVIISVGYYYIRKFNNAFFAEKTNYLTYSYESKPIHFDWVINSKGSGGYIEPQAAIIFPVKINGLSHRFHLQFDTGAPHSYIYENDLKSLRALGIDIKEVEKNGDRFVEQIEFQLDSNNIKASMVKILPNYGHSFDKNDTISKIGIGTIGSDFITNKISSIDFKNQTLELYNQRPNWMQTLPEFKPFDFTGRRIMLPTKIKDKEYELFYDSGCSAFGIITIKSRFDDYVDENAAVITYNAKSWNSSIPITSAASSEPITLGNTELSLKRVSYIDMYTAMQPIATPFTRIGGWLGNQPFNESTLILDTQKEEFIVVESE
ncbi:MAG: hypothetical protein ED556_06180 [Winogradskyella sp.]|uniref:hypothetical protein n=1 Tax=Winogradskyella sp. TaxID=1883156 RepID=UPI000F3B648A|nr:hypothetical protein [Winogradskyella sp.]RNC87009.1 MAG: hypothetical protein ED556_06180 [Winogradskyella sp.]